MHGISSDSLAELTETLVSALDGGADAARVAEDLFAVADVLRREPGLRRVATDVSVPAEAKGELLRGIFGDQLHEASLDVLVAGAGRRWGATRDLADALEHLGVVAVVRKADQEDRAEDLENQLFAFERLVSGSPDLRDALSDPARSVADKRELVRDLLKRKATKETIRLAEQSVTGSYRTVAVALDAYQKIAADQRDRLVATVRVARELEDAESRRLTEALANQYGKPVHLNVVVDPSVIGGVRVVIGDEVIDGTVASRLDDARRQLAG